MVKVFFLLYIVRIKCIPIKLQSALAKYLSLKQKSKREISGCTGYH